MDRWLIVLEGQGDVEYKVVSKDLWDWVQNGTMNPQIEQSLRDDYKLHYQRPGEVYDEQKFQDHISTDHLSSSIDNDRALRVAGDEFFSAKEMMNHVVLNKINIVDEWQGCIY